MRKAKECNLPYQENIAKFLFLVFFLLFVTLEWHILLNFSAFSYTPVYVRLTQKKGYVIWISIHKLSAQNSL